MFVVNLGGEGEVPGALDQQPPACVGPHWFAQQNRTLHDLIAAGHAMLVCPNDAVALPDDSVDQVITNSVPVDKPGPLGLGVQSSEIRRILKLGGVWVRDGVNHYRKP